MARRTLLIALLAGSAAMPAGASPPTAAETPQDAVDVIKRVLKRTERACRTDWARIDAVGYEAHWDVDVRIRSSKAGRGLARWTIGSGPAKPRNALARTLARGCPAP